MSSCSRLASPSAASLVCRLPVLHSRFCRNTGGLTMIDHVSTENVDDGGRAAGADSQTLDEFGAVGERNTEIDEGTYAEGRSVRHHYQEMKGFASGLTSDGLKSRDWFTKLLAH